MAKKKNTAPKVRKPSAADVLRLGSDVANAKAQTNPKLWKQLVNRAHAGGYTVAAELSGRPDVLKERTQTGMAKEAQTSVNTAYAPVFADFDKQDSQIKAWDAKRKADNEAYAGWLQTQTDKIMAQSVAADQTLTSQATAARQATTTAWDKLRQQATGNASATPGNVSDPSQSKALQGLATEQAYSEANAASREQTTIDYAKMGADNRALIQAASTGWSAEQEAKRVGDISEALSTLREKRTTAGLQKAADYLAEFAKLKDRNFQVATYNSDTAIARERLGMDQANVLADNAVNKQNATNEANRIKQQGENDRFNRGKDDLNGDGKVTPADLTIKQRIQDSGKDLNGDGVYDIKDVKAAADAGKDITGDGVYDQKDVKVAADIAAKAKADNRPPAAKDDKAAIKKSDDLTRQARSTLSQLLDLHDSYNKGKKGAHKPSEFRHVLIKKGALNPLIDLAEDYRTHGNKLSPKGIALAKRLGILNPESVVL